MNPSIQTLRFLYDMGVRHVCGDTGSFTRQTLSDLHKNRASVQKNQGYAAPEKTSSSHVTQLHQTHDGQTVHVSQVLTTREGDVQGQGGFQGPLTPPHASSLQLSSRELLTQPLKQSLQPSLLSTLPPHSHVHESMSMARSSLKAALNPNHPAYACKTLSELKQAVLDFDGCDLKHTAINTVFCDGNPDADIMLIGEAPGAQEDEQGKPFVGRSGQLLDKMMGAIGLDRTRVYISNIVPWRPPANRPPTTQEIAACLPFIDQHIHLKAPKFLLLLGGVPTKALLQDNSGIMRLRGKWHSYTPLMRQQPDLLNASKGENSEAGGPKATDASTSTHPSASDMIGIRVLPTFHPAFLLRSPNQKVYAWEDLKMLKAAVDDVTRV